MDRQLTRSEKYRIMQIGPEVEALVLPIILSSVANDPTSLQPCYQTNTKIVSFFLRSRIRGRQRKQEHYFRDHVGLIRRAKSMQPDIVPLKVIAEAFSMEFTEKQPHGYPYPIPYQELHMFPMTWRGNLGVNSRYGQAKCSSSTSSCR